MRLGQLRRNQEVLRLGDIHFFQAEDQKLGFKRSLDGKSLSIYVNRSDDPWDVPAGKVLFGSNLRTVAPDWLTLAPMGFCVVED